MEVGKRQRWKGTIFSHIITVLPCSPLLYGHLFSLFALLSHRDMDHRHQTYTAIDLFTIAHGCLTLCIFHQTLKKSVTKQEIRNNGKRWHSQSTVSIKSENLLQKIAWGIKNNVLWFIYKSPLTIRVTPIFLDFYSVLPAKLLLFQKIQLEQFTSMLSYSTSEVGFSFPSSIQSFCLFYYKLPFSPVPHILSPFRGLSFLICHQHVVWQTCAFPLLYLPLYTSSFCQLPHHMSCLTCPFPKVPSTSSSMKCERYIWVNIH